jgi:hypothetical protein
VLLRNTQVTYVPGDCRAAKNAVELRDHPDSPGRVGCGRSRRGAEPVDHEQLGSPA